MSKTKKDHPEPSRLQWKINHYIGLGLIFLIFFAVNFISEKRFYRKNISTSTYTQLTDLSKNLIKSLKDPVEVINYVSVQDDPMSGMIADDVSQLLQEYAYYGGEKITIKKVDPYVDYDIARSIANEFKVALQESVIIVKKGDQHKIINYRDLADISGGGMYSEAPPKVNSFNAEREITSAIQSLSEQKKSVIYFVTGHGEYDIDADYREKLGLSKLATYIRRQNIDVKKVNLIEEGKIPDDADLIVVAGPRTPYVQNEIDMLHSYIQRDDNRAGRLLLCLDPRTESGLEDLLSDYGVAYRNDIALTKVIILGQVRIMADSIITQVAAHPSTEWMQGRQLNMGLGQCRSLKITQEEKAAKSSKPLALLMTPDQYWGETNLDLSDAKFDGNKDTSGPLTIGVLLDEGSLSGGQVNLKADRIVALGGAEFLSNQSIQGNQLDLFLNITNWMLDKEDSLGIAPKSPEEFNLTLEDRQKRILSGTMVLLIPILGLVAGFIVWLRRRK